MGRLVLLVVILIISGIVWAISAAVSQVSERQRDRHNSFGDQTQKTMKSVAKGVNWLNEQWETAKHETSQGSHRPVISGRAPESSLPSDFDELFEYVKRILKQQLQGTLALAGGSIHVKYLSDDWSRGYLFGLADALLQDIGLNNQTESLAGLTFIHMKLFGESDGPQYFGVSLDRQESRDFISGLKKAMSELNDLHQFGRQPTALSEHLDKLNMLRNLN